MSDLEEIPVTASGDRPVQIVKIDDESEEHNFILDENALNDILNKDYIKDKPVCIISVAGDCGMKMGSNSHGDMCISRCLQERQIFPPQFYAQILGKWCVREVDRP